MFEKKKKEETNMKDVEKQVDDIKQEKPKLSFDRPDRKEVEVDQPQQTIQETQEQETEVLKTFVVSVLDVEDQLNIGVIAPDIMTALQKFAIQFQPEFRYPMTALNIVIEEITFIK